MNSIWAVIPAAGTGSRMGTSKPKQYLTLQGKTVLEHSIDLFLGHPLIEGVIVAVNPSDSYWPAIDSSINGNLLTVNGGEQRAESVFNGLTAITGETSWALVHDAARPCLTRSDLDKLIESRSEYLNGAILGLPLVDTLKKAKPESNSNDFNSQKVIDKTFNRNEFYRALTPQLAPVKKLKLSLSSTVDQKVTDEAQAMELNGFSMGIVVGRSDNIKITYKEDLRLAEFFLKEQVKLGLREL